MTEDEATTAVARAMFPSADWQDEHLAYVQCPGIELHTGSNGRKDCRLTINDGRPPTLFCVHQSCEHVLAQKNKEMRSTIGKLKTATKTGNHARAGLAPVPTTLRAATTVQARRAAPEPQQLTQLAPAALPVPIADGQRLHLEACFAADELIAVVLGAGPAGKPINAGEVLPRIPLQHEHDNGTFIRVNPMKPGGRGDADVTAWRHCLLECDKAPLELQWSAIQASGLPVSVVVHSGKRSVHAWVRVDASTAEEYRQRAAAAADAMERFDGIKVDRQALNPSRLARLAGRRRGDAVQELLAVNIGASCWDDWLAMAKEQPDAEPQPVAPELPKAPTAVQFYYRKHQKDYLLVRDNSTNVVPLTEAGLKSALKFEGIVDGGDKEGLERAAYDIKLETGIDYDGPMPGYSRGLHVESGQRCFVNSAPVPVAADTSAAVDVTEIGAGWPNILALLERLLLPDNSSRMPLLHLCWSLKLARESLFAALKPPTEGGQRNVRPGPVTVFCGPKNCGKTLLVNLVVTPLLGGRSVDAHKGFSGDADGFNGELLAGEVWIVDDKIHSCDLKSRRQFGANIKSKLYAGKVGFHAKFKEQITITPWARLFICCNDQDEAIRVLPVLTDDLADKMHLFRCYSGQAAPTESAEDWESYGEAIRSELPAFAAWVDQLTIPENRRDSRNGMKCWQDPHIVHLLAEQTPEHQLALLLVHLFDTEQLKTQRGKTAQELLEHLCNIEPVKWQVKSLLHDDPALLGRYLGRLIAEPKRLENRGLTIQRDGKRREAWIYTVGTLHS
jgi:hypothetical protein